MKIPTKCMMLVAAMVATAGICAAQGNGGGGGNAPVKPPAGTVTSITAGAGLTGGTITTTGTISVDFGPSGSATTVSRSDHNHDSRYLKLAGGTLATDGPQIVPAFGNIGFGNGPGSTFFYIQDTRVKAAVTSGPGLSAQNTFTVSGGSGGDTSDQAVGGTGGHVQLFGGRGGKGDSFDNHEGGWGAILSVLGGAGGLPSGSGGGGQGGAAMLRGGDGGGGGGARPGGKGGPVFIDGGTGGDYNGWRGATGDVFINTGNTSPGFRGNTWVGGDLILTNTGTAIIFKSPDGGKCTRLAIDNTGNFAVTLVACP
jgi:hypothetical protein